MYINGEHGKQSPDAAVVCSEIAGFPTVCHMTSTYPVSNSEISFRPNVDCSLRVRMALGWILRYGLYELSLVIALFETKGRSFPESGSQPQRSYVNSPCYSSSR